jgi:PilZ domain
LSERKRVTPRIVPPSPITVAVEDDAGHPVAYGVIVDISGSGACLWMDAELAVGATLLFRISFAEPPDVHEVVGEIVWSEAVPDPDGRGGRRCGIEWVGATRACRERLRDLAGRAVRPVEAERYPFQVRWRVAPPRSEV